MPLVLVETIVPGVRTAATRSNEAALDVEVFGDGFDDPIAIAQAAEIVFEIAGRDQRLGGIGEETDGPLFGGVLDAGERGGVALGLIGKDNVEQIDRISGIGKMGGDARTHGSGAQNRDTAKGLERHASPLLGEFQSLNNHFVGAHAAFDHDIRLESAAVAVQHGASRWRCPGWLTWRRCCRRHPDLACDLP